MDFQRRSFLKRNPYTTFQFSEAMQFYEGYKIKPEAIYRGRLYVSSRVVNR